MKILLSLPLSLVLLLAGCTHLRTTKPGPSEAYCEFALAACDVVQSEIPELTRVAEIIAERHLRGGLIGFPWNYQGLQQELFGRSGGIVHIGFERPWKTNRTEAEKTNDVALISWERQPQPADLSRLAEVKARGTYIVGFGPRKAPFLAEFVARCDAWFDTGFRDPDCVVRLADGTLAGRGNCLMNTLHGWALTAEIVSALTRRGKMPTMWKSYSFEDGRDWGARYLGVKPFHDDYHVPPQPPGRLARQFLDQIRDHVRRFQKTQAGAVRRTADLIVAELRAGRPVLVAAMGHMPWTYVGKYEDQRWAQPFDLHSNHPNQVRTYLEKSPQGALVLRLGYSGQHRDETAIFDQKSQRVILIAADNPLPDWQIPTNLVARIDMGWAFGDACVTLPGYPIKILPPSGIMQLVAYECVNVEVLQRLGSRDE